MSVKRIKAIISQSWYYQKHSFEAWIDTLWWSLISLFAFGFLAIFIAGGVANSEKAAYLLIGMILWDIVRQGQETLSLAILRDIWSRNLSNLFTTPLTIADFIVAQMIFGLIKTTIIFILLSFAALKFYDFSIFKLGWFLPIAFLSLLWFSWTAGIFILGLLFRFGTRLQALTWSLVIVLQPITGVFYPIEILPPFLQTISKFFPITYIFALSREFYFTQAINWQMLGIATFQNIVYFILAVVFFKSMFEKAKKTGQFARLEG